MPGLQRHVGPSSGTALRGRAVFVVPEGTTPYTPRPHFLAGNTKSPTSISTNMPHIHKPPSVQIYAKPQISISDCKALLHRDHHCHRAANSQPPSVQTCPQRPLQVDDAPSTCATLSLPHCAQSSSALSTYHVRYEYPYELLHFTFHRTVLRLQDTSPTQFRLKRKAKP